MKKEITQKLLRKYNEMHNREKQIQMQRKKLRAELLELYKQGASIQPGKFQLYVSTHTGARIPWTIEVLGEDVCNDLRQRIPFSSALYVSVQEKESSGSGSNNNWNQFVFL